MTLLSGRADMNEDNRCREQRKGSVSPTIILVHIVDRESGKNNVATTRPKKTSTPRTISVKMPPYARQQQPAHPSQAGNLRGNDEGG